uniref:Ig-like domain-containing protein n=1 Tax=Mesocestoides corti TaxID=53468 RepID=A0A5K3ERZ2_MESCO
CRRIRAQTCWTTWPQPILCLSVFQWHARKISSQPEKDTTEEQYIMNGLASVVYSDERRLTCESTRTKSLVNYSLGPQPCHIRSSDSVELDILRIMNSAKNQARSRGQQCGDVWRLKPSDHAALSQSSLPLRSNGMRGRQSADW